MAFVERRLIRIGRNLAVTLPSEVVQGFKLKKGQKVEVSVHPTTGAVTIRVGVKYFEDGKVTPRFRRLVKETLRRHEKAYRALAKA